MSKYQEVNKQLTQSEIDWIIEYFRTTNNPKRVSYNREEGLFYWYFGGGFSTKDKVIPDKNMDFAYTKLLQYEERENILNTWREEYGEAVQYFYNNARVDEKGIYIKEIFYTI